MRRADLVMMGFALAALGVMAIPPSVLPERVAYAIVAALLGGFLVAGVIAGIARSKGL